MTRSPSNKKQVARWSAAALGFGLLVYVAGLLGWHAIRPVPLIPAGCEVVHEDDLCEVRDDHKLRLWVDAPKDARLFLFQGLHRILPETAVAVEGGGQLISLTVPPGSSAARTLTVVVDRGVLLQWTTSRVSDRREAPWLREARQTWLDNQVEAAFALAQKHFEEPMSPSDRAQATSLVANIQIERNDLPEAIRLFQRAMDEDRTARLISGELRDAIALAGVLGQNLRRFDEAERLIREKEPLFVRQPDLQAWKALLSGLFRQMRGDFQGALPPTEAGMAWAVRFGDASVLGELRMLRAEVLEALGRTGEAQAELDRIHGELLPPCRRAGVFQERGRMRLVALEAVGAVGAAGAAEAAEARPDLDPSPFFRQSLILYRHECEQRLPIASVLTGLARAALLYGRVDEAANHLRDARAAAGDPDAELLIDGLDLEGQIALVKGRFEEAAAIYQRLLDLARKDPGSGLSYGSLWHAWVGLAQAWEAIDPASERALEAYRRAEEYLDERGREIPLGAGRGGFLGRHERGTGFYLDLLVRRGRQAEALRVLRHARVRGLLALGNLARSTTWSDAQREAWRVKMEAYRQKRSELDQILYQKEGADLTRRQVLAEQQSRLQMRLQALAMEAPLLDGWNLSPDALRKIEPGEVLLACHPARGDWLCLAEKGDAVTAVRLQRLDRQVARADLERTLLTPLASLLGDARTLRVLAFGAMRQIDFAALPLGGRRLGDRVAVSYALDLPSAPQSATVPSTGGQPKALLLIDPLSDLPGSQALAEKATSLLAPYWQVSRHQDVPHLIGNGVEPRPGPRFLGDALRTRLAAADLFFYYGHSDFLPSDPVPSGDWTHSLRTADQAGLTVSDILVLDRVPRWVVLAGCESGLSDEETGGLEGVGLAQAFLLRGSAWVIGSVRKVNYKVSAALAIALLEAGLDQPGADPIATLERARSAARERLAQRGGIDAGVRDNDLDAFRVFVL